jgi:methionyl-tRNA formyltransferase
VKRAAEALGLRVLSPEKLKPFVAEARALGADAFVVASYGKIVPQALLDLVPIAFNVHPSMLPLYRGATPLQSVIRNGLSKTGVTIIAMDAGMDTGDVLLQERAEIGPSETYGELHDRLAKRGAELAVEALERYANGTLERKPQSEIARELGFTDDGIARTTTRPLTKDDLVIDWRKKPAQIVNQVRSLAPQPLARTESMGEPLKILAAREVTPDQLADELGGVIGTSDERLHPGGSPGHRRLYSFFGHPHGVVVDRVIAPNRGPMSGEAFAQRQIDEFQRKVEELRRR